MADTLAFHAAAPGGSEGFVLLLERTGAGPIRWRQWSSVDYLAPAQEGTSPAADVARRVEGWARDGWAMSESPHRIMGWLRAHD